MSLISDGVVVPTNFISQCVTVPALWEFLSLSDLSKMTSASREFGLYMPAAYQDARTGFIMLMASIHTIPARDENCEFPELDNPLVTNMFSVPLSMECLLVQVKQRTFLPFYRTLLDGLTCYPTDQVACIKYTLFQHRSRSVEHRVSAGLKLLKFRIRDELNREDAADRYNPYMDVSAPGVARLFNYDRFAVPVIFDVFLNDQSLNHFTQQIEDCTDDDGERCAICCYLIENMIWYDGWSDIIHGTILDCQSDKALSRMEE
jgi:hypothetical protein